MGKKGVRVEIMLENFSDQDIYGDMMRDLARHSLNLEETLMKTDHSRRKAGHYAIIDSPFPGYPNASKYWLIEALQHDPDGNVLKMSQNVLHIYRGSSTNGKIQSINKCSTTLLYGWTERV
jgi:hypothetical protein